MDAVGFLPYYENGQKYYRGWSGTGRIAHADRFGKDARCSPESGHSHVDPGQPLDDHLRLSPAQTCLSETVGWCAVPMSVSFLRLLDLGTMLARQLLLLHARGEAGVGCGPGHGRPCTYQPTRPIFTRGDSRVEPVVLRDGRTATEREQPVVLRDGRTATEGGSPLELWPEAGRGMSEI